MLELIDYPSDLTPMAFPAVAYQGAHWDLSHLTPFAFKIDPGLGVQIDVVVLFSCHCFTHGLQSDSRQISEIPPDELFKDNREVRVLNPERYHLSQEILRPLVLQLPKQRIIVANETQRNFLTWEVTQNGTSQIYGVFFDVERDRARSKRLILRIQSAYVLTDGLTKRQKQAKKVSWTTLLKAAYEGRKIRP